MKKLALNGALLLLISLSGICYAGTDLCSSLTGVWTGSYTDNNNRHPIRMYLDYQDGYVYGYTLSSADGSGYGFGSGGKTIGTGKYLMWANCTSSKISNLAFVNNEMSCGAVNPNEQPVHIGIRQPLVMSLPYNSGTVTITLSPQKSHVVVNQNLINQAINLGANPSALSSLSTCQG